MSMAACKCGAWIDTDEDTECYYVTHEEGSEKKLDEPLCTPCRERAQDQNEELRNVLGEALEKVGVA